MRTFCEGSTNALQRLMLASGQSIFCAELCDATCTATHQEAQKPLILRRMAGPVLPCGWWRRQAVNGAA